MDSPLLDQSPDPLLAFASEAPVTPTAEREPAFLRTPTPYDGHLSITSLAVQPPRSETVHGSRVTTFLVAVGVVAGFAAGYAYADRIIGPAATPADRVAVPPSPAPPPTPAAAPAVTPAASNETAKPVTETARPVTEPSAEPVLEPAVSEAVQTTHASAAPAPSTPRSTRRETIPSSTRRPSTTTRPRAEVAPTTLHSGAIQIVSRPRDAKVLLDGNVVGLAPLSIPDVPEGLHEVRVELDGFSPWVGAVRVKGGSRARVGASLQP
jgi:hypothetical protein